MAKDSNARRRQGSAARATTTTLLALLIGCAGIASAASGVGAVGGGAAAPGTPKLRDAICLSGCVGLRKATVGATVQASGSDMSAVRSVTFKGNNKRITAPISSATETTVQAVVPPGAQSGKLRVKDSYGQKSELSEKRISVRPRSELQSSNAVNLTEAEVSPRKVFYYGARSATLSYVIGGDQPTDLRIDIVTPSGQVVQSFLPTAVQPHSTNTIAWNGTGADGKPVPSGWYAFRISAADGTPVAGASRSSVANLGVGVYSYIFPIRGKHTYGDGLGAPRSGHSHQGVDVFAPCGTKLVAARGGKVQYAGYQGSAGNYLVIDQKGSGEDNAYMHMQAPSPLKAGDRVRTGQYVGNAGDTGNASGCHLHFERWAAPGWYEGGSPLDPTAVLKQWDKYS